MVGISSKLTKGSIWLSAARAIVNLLGFASTIVLARLLLPGDFGIVAIGNTLLVIVSAFTALPLSQALIQHKEPTMDHFHTAWTLGAARGIAVGALIAALAVPAARLYEEPQLEYVLYGLAFSTALSGLGNPRRIMLQKSLVFWQDFILSVSQKLAVVVVSIAVAYVYQSYWALILGIIAGQIVSIVVSYTVLPFLPKFSVRHWPDLWSFSMWMMFSQVVNTLNWRFDQLVLGKFISKTELGYYTVGDSLAVLPTREATQPLTQTLFPGFSSLTGDAVRLRNAYTRAQALVTAIALPCGLGTALVAEPMVELFMGDKWLPAVIVIQTLAGIYALQTLGSLAQPLGMALGQTKLLFSRDMTLFCIRLPIIAAGILLGGLHGVLIARVFTGTISIAFDMSICKRLIGLTRARQLLSNIRCIAACGVMALGLSVAPSLLPPADTPTLLAVELGALILLGAALYVAATLILWVAAGRPAGPEIEIMSIAGKLLEKLGRRKRTAF